VHLTLLLAFALVAPADVADAAEPRLVKAVKARDLQKVQRLLKAKKHNPNVMIDSEGRPALVLAAEYGSLDIVRALLDAGAAIDATTKRVPGMVGQDEGSTALHQVGSLTYDRQATLAVARALLNAGADVNVRSLSGNTPLINAARRGNVALVQLLLEAGADIHSRNSSGATALVGPAIGGDGAMIRALVHAGADVNATDLRGRTPFIHAAFNANQAAIDALVESGAKVNARDEEGRTALFQVTYPSRALKVLRAGVDIHLKDNMGRTALSHVAQGEWFGNRRNNLKMAKFLIQNGARVDERDSLGRPPAFSDAEIETLRQWIKDEFLFEWDGKTLSRSEGKNVVPPDDCLDVRHIVLFDQEGRVIFEHCNGTPGTCVQGWKVFEPFNDAAMREPVQEVCDRAFLQGTE
jgi:ankyrin repeat protein